MRTEPNPPAVIASLLKSQDRTYKWLSRQTGIGYQRLLREAKHGVQPMSLLHAAQIADALDVSLPVLISETGEEAA